MTLNDEEEEEQAVDVVDDDDDYYYLQESWGVYPSEPALNSPSCCCCGWAFCSCIVVAESPETVVARFSGQLFQSNWRWGVAS